MTLTDIEMRLEIINIELQWLLSRENRGVYENERINVLRTQQRVLIEDLGGQ